MARCHIFGKSVQHKQKQCINNANQIVNLVWNQIFNKVGFVQGWAALESKWQEVSDLLLSCICLGFLPLVTLSIIIFTCCSTDSRRIYWGGKLFKTIEKFIWMFWSTWLIELTVSWLMLVKVRWLNGRSYSSWLNSSSWSDNPFNVCNLVSVFVKLLSQRMESECSLPDWSPHKLRIRVQFEFDF